MVICIGQGKHFCHLYLILLNRFLTHKDFAQEQAKIVKKLAKENLLVWNQSSDSLNISLNVSRFGLSFKDFPWYYKDSRLDFHSNVACFCQDVCC